MRLLAAALLLTGAGAMAAPYAITYHGTIDAPGPDIAAHAPAGAPFTLTLVFDNGNGTAASQSWDGSQLTCGFWRWRASPAGSTTTVARVLSGPGGVLATGSAATNGAGALTAVFSAVSTGGPRPWAEFSVSAGSLPAGASIGWDADGLPLQVFGFMFGGGGGSFYDGSTGPGGGVQMAPGRWSAPLPFTGACDATAVPPAPILPTAVPALSPWGVLLLPVLLGLAVFRRRI